MSENSASSEYIDVKIEISKTDKFHNCPKCSRNFGNVGYLRCHFLKVHPEFRLTICMPKDLHQCDVCKKNYSSKHNLQEHKCVLLNKEPEETVSQIKEPEETCVSQIRESEETCVSQNKEPVEICVSQNQEPEKTCVSQNKEPEGTCVSQNKKPEGTCVSLIKGPEKTRVSQKKKPEKTSKYKCEKCGKCYAQRSGLIKHRIRVHSKERIHICKICNKEFSSKYWLSAHARVHEKEIVCGGCDNNSTIEEDHNEECLQRKHTQIKRWEVCLPDTSTLPLDQFLFI
ncbi:zinc finger protein [Trichonephila clavata]|uniref:Zinc finger protein n=1 Tax=Trichonephila clavata TaxID=2740835 RepID=A0A8X6F4Q1_TRICU|nr:zinc finger protein [Trichonephila clavata]